MTDNFSIMPVDIFMDDRLSKTDLRVLGAIKSWCNQETNLCYPSRDQISERCGLAVNKITDSTTRLVKFGWLEKYGNGGRSLRCTYKFCIPDLTKETHPDLGTVKTHPKLGTVNTKTHPDSGTKTHPDSGTKTHPDLGRGKKLKENLKITKSNKGITLVEFLNQCRDNKEPVLPESCGVFKYAEDVGIPFDYLKLGWIKFKSIYIDKNKRYKDWRLAFYNHVKEGWLRIWAIDGNNNYYLTTSGKQLQKEMAA